MQPSSHQGWGRSRSLDRTPALASLSLDPEQTPLKKHNAFIFTSLTTNGSSKVEEQRKEHENEKHKIHLPLPI